MKTLAAIGLGAALLAGCGTSSVDRAASGAVIGAGAAAVTERDVAAGAALGAAAGVLLDAGRVNLGRGPVEGS